MPETQLVTHEQYCGSGTQKMADIWYILPFVIDYKEVFYYSSLFFYKFQICLNNMGRIRIQTSKTSYLDPDPEKSFRIHNTAEEDGQIVGIPGRSLSRRVPKFKLSRIFSPHYSGTCVTSFTFSFIGERAGSREILAGLLGRLDYGHRYPVLFLR